MLQSPHQDRDPLAFGYLESTTPPFDDVFLLEGSVPNAEGLEEGFGSVTDFIENAGSAFLAHNRVVVFAPAAHHAMMEEPVSVEQDMLSRSLLGGFEVLLQMTVDAGNPEDEQDHHAALSCCALYLEGHGLRTEDLLSPDHLLGSSSNALEVHETDMGPTIEPLVSDFFSHDLSATACIGKLRNTLKAALANQQAIGTNRGQEALATILHLRSSGSQRQAITVVLMQELVEVPELREALTHFLTCPCVPRVDREGKAAGLLTFLQFWMPGGRDHSWVGALLPSLSTLPPEELAAIDPRDAGWRAWSRLLEEFLVEIMAPPTEEQGDGLQHTEHDGVLSPVASPSNSSREKTSPVGHQSPAACEHVSPHLTVRYETPGTSEDPSRDQVDLRSTMMWSTVGSLDSAAEDAGKSEVEDADFPTPLRPNQDEAQTCLPRPMKKDDALQEEDPAKVKTEEEGQGAAVAAGGATSGGGVREEEERGREQEQQQEEEEETITAAAAAAAAAKDVVEEEELAEEEEDVFRQYLERDAALDTAAETQSTMAKTICAQHRHVTQIEARCNQAEHDLQLATHELGLAQAARLEAVDRLSSMREERDRTVDALRTSEARRRHEKRIAETQDKELQVTQRALREASEALAELRDQYHEDFAELSKQCEEAKLANVSLLESQLAVENHWKREGEALRRTIDALQQQLRPDEVLVIQPSGNTPEIVRDMATSPMQAGTPLKSSSTPMMETPGGTAEILRSRLAEATDALVREQRATKELERELEFERQKRAENVAARTRESEQELEEALAHVLGRAPAAVQHAPLHTPEETHDIVVPRIGPSTETGPAATDENALLRRRCSWLEAQMERLQEEMVVLQNAKPKGNENHVAPTEAPAQASSSRRNGSARTRGGGTSRARLTRPKGRRGPSYATSHGKSRLARSPAESKGRLTKSPLAAHPKTRTPRGLPRTGDSSKLRTPPTGTSIPRQALFERLSARHTPKPKRRTRALSSSPQAGGSAGGSSGVGSSDRSKGHTSHKLAQASPEQSSAWLRDDLEILVQKTNSEVLEYMSSTRSHNSRRNMPPR